MVVAEAGGGNRQSARALKLKARYFIGAALAAVLLCGTIGCGGPDLRGRMPGPPPPPPRYPPARNVPLDPQLRTEAHRELESDFHSQNPEIRSHALESLRNSGGAASARDVLAALSDPAPEVRYGACLAAGELQLKDAHDTLLRLVDDGDAAVRVAARFALHRIGDFRHSHELEQLSRDPEARVRGTTAMVLGMIGEPSAIKLLEPMRHDPHPAVRQQAATALWQLGSPQGRDDLIGWEFSVYQDDRMIGLLGLAAPHNRDVIQHIRSQLVSEWPGVSLAAARGMGMLGSDEGYGVAQTGARSSDPRDRIQAALAFGAIGRSDAQEILRSLLQDSNPNVRIAAAEAILELKPEFTPARGP
jgi:HEAT repeat protein